MSILSNDERLAKTDANQVLKSHNREEADRPPLREPVDNDFDLTIPVFGVRITPLSPGQLYTWIDSGTLPHGHKSLILNHNLHSLYLYETNHVFRNLYKSADVILADGFPVLKLAQLQKPCKLSSVNRVGSLDWVPNISDAKTVKRLAVIGASEDSNSSAVQRLSDSNPKVDVMGWSGESWNTAKASFIVDRLHEFRPDVVLVGLGMPIQETFLSHWWDYLPTATYATVGGAIDQIAGIQRAAPRWLGHFGLEWAWRLATQPRRLGSRYLLEPWRLVSAALSRQILRGGRFGDE